MKQALQDVILRTSQRLFAFSVVCSLAMPAFAVSQGSLLSRMDRIEQRLLSLEAPTSDSRAFTAADAAPVGSTARFEVTIAEMQAELRALRGEIQELRFQQTQLQGSVKRLEQDMDLRLETLERGTINADTASTDSSISAPVIGQTPAIEADTTSPQAPVIKEPNETSQASQASASEAYQAAFDALNAGKIGDAEIQFATFIDKHPEHTLIGNAHYWLGEAYYVQEQFDAAAEQFRQGFQLMPEGPKAPDNLLRLGMTLEVLERRDEACIILKQLLEKYKGRSESVLRKATRESESLGCS